MPSSAGKSATPTKLAFDSVRGFLYIADTNFFDENYGRTLWQADVRKGGALKSIVRADNLYPVDVDVGKVRVAALGAGQRRGDELPEERSRPLGAALELGVGLGADPERVALELDELDQAVGEEVGRIRAFGKQDRFVIAPVAQLPMGAGGGRRLVGAMVVVLALHQRP